jgi:hypothetical protein
VVHGVQARVAQVVEQVGEPGRRAQQEQHVQRDDAADHETGPDGPSSQHDDQPGGQHRQQRAVHVAVQDLGIPGKRPPQPVQRAGEPCGEGTVVRRGEHGAALGGGQDDATAEHHLSEDRELGERAPDERAGCCDAGERRRLGGGGGGHADVLAPAPLTVVAAPLGSR